MEFNKEELPKHIAIIMDGNRRWARAKGMPVAFGHKEGAKVLEKIVRHANEIGLEYITVYAFSTENWKRAEEEVKSLMLILQNYLEHYAKVADSENIKSKVKILRADEYEEAVRLAAENAEEGDVVLLSPASTSFDRFKNFEERGKLFKDLVNSL